MENVIGHEKVKKILNGAVAAGTVSHAYIFEGEPGIGRLTLAKAFASKITGGVRDVENNPDITIATPSRFGDTKKKTPGLSISAVREIKTDVYTRPYLAERKVYIIPDADFMGIPAQNSLLKVFEEPPEYCTIILIVKNANSLLQTIRSRAMLIRMLPIEREQTEKYLVDKFGMDKKRAEVLSIISGGSIGRAVALEHDADIIELRDELIKKLIACLDTNKRPLYDLILFLKKNSGSFKEISGILTTWFEDIMRLKFGISSENITNADKTLEIQKFSRAITKASAVALCDAVTKYSLVIDKNANYSVAVQCMAMECWEEIHGRNYRSAL